MSALGQKRKSSERANTFRFASQSGPPIRALMSNVLLIYPPGCAARGCSQERLSSNSALVLQAPVAIHISLQLLIAHVRKLVHALAHDLRLRPGQSGGLQDGPGRGGCGLHHRGQHCGVDGRYYAQQRIFRPRRRQRREHCVVSRCRPARKVSSLPGSAQRRRPSTATAAIAR
jgi:hypothetical protein